MSFGKGRTLPLQPKAPPPGVASGEKRSSSRRAAKTPGLIYPGGIAASSPCMIVDQSFTGACLKMQEGWVNPFLGSSSLGQTFTLVMRLDRMEVDCEIMRLEELEIGIRFTSAARPLKRKI